MMSKTRLFAVSLTMLALLAADMSVVSAAKKKKDFVSRSVESAVPQMRLLLDTTDTAWASRNPADVPSPRTTDRNGRTGFTSLDDWTSGFFPGSLWYMYELTGDTLWRTKAVRYTEGMERIKYYTGNHDIGFMIFCSFGNGLRLTGKESYKDVIVTAAQTLTKRYRPGAGVIQSWNANARWRCPVIIDNMMNLELLFEATRMSGDSTYWNIAVSHADKTIANHFRPDYGSYHVIDYDPETGEVLHRNTHQGYAHESTWSRGEAWGLYGYVLCYRYTRDERYLDQARRIASYIIPRLPANRVPHWDYDAPPRSGDSAVLRDASAASIMASAFYELSTYAEGNAAREYRGLADQILTSLASPAYRAPEGRNGNFLIMHCVGNLPGPGEVDVPLVYADYYFLEALKRKRDLDNR